MVDTAAFYDWLVDKVAKGHRVDVLDLWAGAEICDIQTRQLSLSSIKREEFWFLTLES